MEKIKIRKILFLCFMIILQACEGGGSTTGTGVIDTSRTTIVGNVKDTNGQPVSNAEIKVGNEQQVYTTDTQGNFVAQTSSNEPDLKLEITAFGKKDEVTISNNPDLDNVIKVTFIVGDDVKVTNDSVKTSKSCKNDSECDGSDYCNFDNMSCGSSGEGTCRRTEPSVCLTVIDEVCGCDGKIYSNPCFAREAGVSIAPKESCNNALPGLPSPTCNSNNECSEGSYCKFDDNQCGATRPGTCELIPQPGSCIGLTVVVQGCDGQTYSDTCEAAYAGQSYILGEGVSL